MKYQPERDIPLAVRELKDLSPSKIADWILRKRNVERTPESVTMWLKDHKDAYDQLAEELVKGAPTEKQAVDAGLFENGAFKEIPSVKDWILYMSSRRRKNKALHPVYVQTQLNLLKRACQLYEKHPDRLSYRDAQEIFYDMETKGKDSCCYRRAIKDFLKSKGVSEWEKIGVGKPRGYGTLKTLFVEKSIVLEMLEWTKAQDFHVYVADEIMWHNGLRLNAVLTSKIENFKEGKEWTQLTVLEKFREEKTFLLLPEVSSLIKQVIGDRKEGLIFAMVDERKINILNREALKKFVPELEPKIEMPSHFYRHMCAQHLYRATDYNSDICAGIMQCTVQSFKESYGGAPEGQVKVWAMKYLPMLQGEAKPCSP
jgi:integrase